MKVAEHIPYLRPGEPECQPLAANALRAVVMNPIMAALIARNASRRHPTLINVMHAGCLYAIRMMTWQIALLRQTVEVTVNCHR